MNRNNWTDDKILFRLINNKSKKTRWDNISVLRQRPSKELFLKCETLTKSLSAKERSIGVDVLAQMGLPPRPFLKQTLNLYFGLLNVEKDPDVLMGVLYAIGHNNDNLSKTQIAKLCSFSKSKDNWVKEGLVFSLLGIEDVNAIEILIKLSEDKQSHIRNLATFGIGTQIEVDNNKIREALWKRVNDKHQETKLEAIVGLALRKDERVLEIIKRELLNKEYGILLFEAIIETKDKQFLPLLVQNLESGRKDKGVNSVWLQDLENCIVELKKL